MSCDAIGFDRCLDELHCKNLAHFLLEFARIMDEELEDGEHGEFYEAVREYVVSKRHVQSTVMVFAKIYLSLQSLFIFVTVSSHSVFDSVSRLRSSRVVTQNSS